MLKREIKDLAGHKSLLVFLFFGILFLDAFGAIFPEFFNRRITLFLPLPIILIHYLINAKNKNKLFLITVGLNLLGLVNFNTVYEAYDSLGVMFHTFAYFGYFIIVFKYHYEIIDLRNIFRYSLLIMTLVSVFVVLYSEGIKRMLIFYDTLLYIASVTLFMIFAVVLRVVRKTTASKFLMFSVISIFLSSCFQGYNLFVKPFGIALFFAIIGLNLTHFFMVKFLLEQEREKKKILAV